MIRILSTILLGLILYMGQAQNAINRLDSNGQKQGFWQKKQTNGNLAYEGTFLNDQPLGEFKRYHANGLLKARLFYPEDSDTISAELFDIRGKLMAKGNYVGEKKQGLWQYFQNGQLISEEVFENNQKHGTSKTYYPTGELFEKTDWKNDLQTGIYRAYFKNGKPYLECRMEGGKRDGACQVYYENGQLELDAMYVQGLRNGDWNYYHPDGTFSHTLTYDLGLLLNPQVLDSIQQIQFNELEKNRSKLIDPEKFMDDPGRYMMENRIPAR
ncbi:toxin-antitoxin system YwqK family antitoxin [Sunxiuqinia dokdonensis]|nr:toxin-antitoxin system YwqK family antitoxin [Sunxiuqinia dokdonensis]